MNRLNLKQKYFFSITLVCLISLLIVSVVSYYSSYQLVLSSTKSKLEMASELYSNEIDSWFLIQKNDLNAIQEDVEINSAYYSDDALLSRMLNYKLKKTQNQILDYYIGFSDKRLLSGIGWQPDANYDCTKRDWYQQAINKGDTVFIAPYVDTMTQEMVITISEPLIMNNQVVGVLAVDITVDYLLQLVKNIKISDGSYAFLLDSQKNIMTYPNREFLPTGGRSYQLDEVMKGRFNSLSEQIDSGKYQLTKLNDYDGQEKYFYLSGIDSAKWVLGFSIPTSEVTNNLHYLLIGFAIAGALSIVISMIVIFALINGLLRPILHLTTIVKQFGKENMDARSEITSTDEIGELGRTFNSMADTIQNYSQTLENKVIERTKELNEKNVKMQDSIEYRKKAEKDLLYMIYHDCLTEIYNRRFYEEELKRLDTKRNLPLTIVMGDVNGLKLINDSFGHTMGDELLRKAAKVIKNACRADDIIARIGGDEFVIILPKTDAFEAEQIIKRIKDLSLKEKVCNIDISISFGYAIKSNEEENIQEIFKYAENLMYRHKRSESSGIRSQPIDFVVNTLYKKNSREQLHSIKVSEICEAIAAKMDFSENDIYQIKIAGLMHDIGKIEIDKKILNKPEKLSKDEWEMMQRHPEIGYRILSSVNEFSVIADDILEHHERWDGKGYPRGLKGEESSLRARIIAVADAYDAMTTNRTYGKALSEEEAMNEIKRCSGTQFDPKVTRVFVEKVLGQEWEQLNKI